MLIGLDQFHQSVMTDFEENRFKNDFPYHEKKNSYRQDFNVLIRVDHGNQNIKFQIRRSDCGL